MFKLMTDGIIRFQRWASRQKVTGIRRKKLADSESNLYGSIYIDVCPSVYEYGFIFYSLNVFYVLIFLLNIF